MKDLKIIFPIWSILGMILSIVLFFYTLNRGEDVGAWVCSLLFIMSICYPRGGKKRLRN